MRRILEPKLVEDFVHGDTARAAYIVGVFGAIAALMQFVFSPVLGRAFRSLRTPSGGVAFELRARTRLPRDGALALTVPDRRVAPVVQP